MSQSAKGKRPTGASSGKGEGDRLPSQSEAVHSAGQGLRDSLPSWRSAAFGAWLRARVMLPGLICRRRTPFSREAPRNPLFCTSQQLLS